MPGHILRFAESALEDLEKIREWYFREGVPDTGNRFVREIFERVEALQNHPKLGRVVPEFDQRFLRELIHPPFRIVYRLDPQHVRVVRVWRSERPLEISPSEQIEV